MTSPVLPDRTIFLLRNTALSLDDNEAALPQRIAERFRLAGTAIGNCTIVRKGIDARKKSRIHYVYTVEFSVANPQQFWEKHCGDPDLEMIVRQQQPALPQISTAKRVVITGSGPAGIFAALRLTDYGIASLLLERGRNIEARIRDVERFWLDGVLDEESNVQFGEGGAGTFSDGKLTTRVRDPNTGYVLRRFVEFGAPPEIQWLAKPHIGTDRLRA
ncbi:MAG: dependent oxidoreductase, partial [Deltaproteobacteria bacterium]|nr:dependent oxidoreductase [Deltaproteobacteria bacterium]